MDKQEGKFTKTLARIRAQEGLLDSLTEFDKLEDDSEWESLAAADQIVGEV